MKTIEITINGKKIAKAWLADCFWLRLRGLLGRRLAEGGGLLLLPCRQIHTFLMPYPIDAIYLDREGTVLRVDRTVRPGRCCAAERQAWAVLELPAGQGEANELLSGCRINLEGLKRRKTMNCESIPHLDGSLPQLREKLDQVRFRKTLLGYSCKRVLDYIAELCDAAVQEHQDHQRVVLTLQRNIALANEDVLTAESRARSAEQREQHLLDQVKTLRQDLEKKELLLQAKEQQLQLLRQQKELLLQSKEQQLEQLRQDITAGRYL